MSNNFLVISTRRGLSSNRSQMARLQTPGENHTILDGTSNVYQLKFPRMAEIKSMRMSNMCRSADHQGWRCWRGAMSSSVASNWTIAKDSRVQQHIYLKYIIAISLPNVELFLFLSHSANAIFVSIYQRKRNYNY